MPTDINLPEDMLVEIEKIKYKISKRLTDQENIDNALENKDWDKAYKIAQESGVDIYDPFATFREAKEAVEQADHSVEQIDQSIKKMREKGEVVKQEVEKIKKYEYGLRNLESLYHALVNVEVEVLEEIKNNDPKNTLSLFMAKLEKSDDYKELSETLSELRVWLREETKYLINIPDLAKLREIKEILITKESITKEDFIWLYDLRQKNQKSQIINRIYAKAEQRFLNQPEPAAGKNHQPDFDSVEQAFRDSRQDDFRKAISELETKLLDEENPLLRRIYQSDLHIWKQRLLVWERAVKLVEEVHGFENKISQSANSENEWADEKNISTLVAALLDLRDIPSEIFVLKTDGKNLALGKSLDETLSKIATNLGSLSPNPLNDKNKKKSDKSIDIETAKEWTTYFENMKKWIEKQEENGQVFMSRLGKNPQPAPGVAKKNSLSLTANKSGH